MSLRYSARCRSATWSSEKRARIAARAASPVARRRSTVIASDSSSRVASADSSPGGKKEAGHALLHEIVGAAHPRDDRHHAMAHRFQERVRHALGHRRGEVDVRLSQVRRHVRHRTRERDAPRPVRDGGSAPPAPAGTARRQGSSGERAYRPAARRRRGSSGRLPFRRRADPWRGTGRRRCSTAALHPPESSMPFGMAWTRSRGTPQRERSAAISRLLATQAVVLRAMLRAKNGPSNRLRWTTDRSKWASPPRPGFTRTGLPSQFPAITAGNACRRPWTT